MFHFLPSIVLIFDVCFLIHSALLCPSRIVRFSSFLGMWPPPVSMAMVLALMQIHPMESQLSVFFSFLRFFGGQQNAHEKSIFF